jgi:hypothetical protein
MAWSVRYPEGFAQQVRIESKTAKFRALNSQ